MSDAPTRNGTRLYSIWKGMKTRCYNPHFKAFPRYGGRGIIVCDEWKNDFLQFKDWALNNGYRDNLTIDRIDNNKGYSPQNCRWVSYKVQANNTRRNIVIQYNGESVTVADICERLGLNSHLVYDRITRLEWNPEDALTIPPRKITTPRKDAMKNERAYN